MMKRRYFEVVLVFVLVSLLSACAVRPSAHQAEVEQPAETTSPTGVPSAQLSPQLTSAPTDDQPRRALPPGASLGEITYLSNRSGVAEIWLLDLATGLERQLTETSCHDVYTGGRIPEWYVRGVQGFTWAPDGRSIAYLATCPFLDVQAQLSVYNLETDSIISVTNRADSRSYPSWAPSGDRLVFSTTTQRGEVYIAELGEQGEPEVEPIARTLLGFPTWSSDGRYIAYLGPEVGLSGTGSRTYISIVDPEWNHLEYEPELLSPIPDFPSTRHAMWIASPSNDGLAWSNNARYLAVASVREGSYSPGGLNLVEVVDQVALTHPGFGQLGPVIPNSFGLDFYNPVFSPDDETLYFVSIWPDTESAVRFGTIYSVPVRGLLGDSSLDVQVVSPEDQLAGFPSISPDGEWLVYAVKVRKATEIWLQAVDGTYRQRLVGDDFVNTRPTWRPLDK